MSVPRLTSLFGLLLLLCPAAQAQDGLLQDGTWIKIAVRSSGIYKLDQAFFQTHAPAFAKADPSLIRVYGGHPTALPQANDAERQTGLREIPVMLQDNNQRWDATDFIAFYAQDPHTIRFENNRFSHEINPYSDVNYYFVTLGNVPSKRISELPSKDEGPVRDHLPFYAYEEKEIKNLLLSGRLWLGEFFRSEYRFSPLAEDYVSDYTLHFELYPMGISRQFVTLSAGNFQRRDTLLGAPHHPNDNLARYFRISNAHAFDLSLESPPTAVQLQLSAESVGNVGVYFNYWSVEYQRRLRFRAGQQTLFRTREESTPYRCRLEEPQATVWQITQGGETHLLQRSATGLFAPINTFGEIVILDLNSLPYPGFAGQVAPQNLYHAAVPELLVVFPEKFRKAAEELISIKNQELETAGYSIQSIYNEFSSGKADPTALRDFCRHLYRQAPEKFRYLLLLGDATYDYKNNLGASYVEIDATVPTYQSRESLEPIYSFASDDYFAFLDPHEGVWPEGESVNNQWVSTSSNDHLMNIAVGRIPAKTVPELNNYIAKYKKYRLGLQHADWHNRIAFVADNRDYNLHQRDAENLEKLALHSFPGFQTEKLYLDDYPVIDDRVPEANQKLHELVQLGTYLISYVGHGAEEGLTSEKLLTLGDILAFNNGDRLPIWFTATCQFGKFDNPGMVSGAELLLLRREGGAIALLTTTRAVYSRTNQAVNQAFFSQVAKAKTLGELFKLTKNNSIRGEINRNFALLGDPSLPLPSWSAAMDFQTDSDTLMGLQPLNFSGSVPSIKEGHVVLTVVDKPKRATTLGSFADGPPFTYSLNSEPLFTGRFAVKNHRFSGSLLLPADQQEGIGMGRVLLHALAEDSTYQSFSGLPVLLHSGSGNSNHDTAPPQLAASLQQDGYLQWVIQDESAIHASRLVLEVNGQVISQTPRYYTPTEGSTAGVLRYYVGHLPNGLHTSTLFAEDVYNNRIQRTFQFETERPPLKIQAVAAFPNPVNDYLRLKVRHNRKGDNLTATLMVSDLLGRTWYSEAFSCTRCEEEFRWESDFTQHIPPFTKVLFRLILRSENHVDEAGGTLFFSK